MFNDLFAKLWSRQYLEQADCDRRRKYIADNSKTFAFPVEMKTGFVKQTTNGITSSKNASRTIQFSEVFSGKEGIIAQWKNARKMDTCYLPETLNYETGHTKRGNEFNEIESFFDWYKNNKDKFIKEQTFYFTKDTSYFSHEGDIYWYNGVDGFYNKEVDTTWNFDEIVIILLDKKYEASFIKVVDYNKKNMSVYPYYEKWFQKGDYFMVCDLEANDSANFTSAPGSNYMGDMQQWELVDKVSVMTTKNFTKDDMFKLYWIPQKSNDEMSDDIVHYYVNNCTKYYDPHGKLVYCQVEFASINDSLSTTGQIIKGSIMLGAPGEGYAIPKLIYNEKGEAIDFKVNELFVGDDGVRTLQVELLGPGAVVGVCAYGRPIEKIGEVNKIYPPRRLFLQDLKFPVSDNLTTNSSPESVFIAGVMKPFIEGYYKDWKESRSADFTESIKKTFDGFFGNPDLTRQVYIDSNPNGLDLRRSDWNLKGKVAGSSPLTTTASPYFSAMQDDGTKYIGSQTIDLNNIESGRAHDLLNFSAMIFEQFPTMPIDNYQTYAWTLSQIPLFGGFLNTITLGIPIGWREQSYFQSDVIFKGIFLLFSMSLFRWYTESFWPDDGSKSGTKVPNSCRIPLDVFKNGSEDEVGGIVNVSAMTTAICSNLTDKITMRTYSTKDGSVSDKDNVYSSVYIKQKLINDKGVNVRPLISEASFATDPLSKDAITDTIGVGKYIIDAIELISVAKMPVRLTTFSEDPDNVSDPYDSVNWQTTIQTKAMLTGNVRDIAQVFKTSYFDDVAVNSNVNFPFPNSSSQDGMSPPGMIFNDIKPDNHIENITTNPDDPIFKTYKDNIEFLDQPYGTKTYNNLKRDWESNKDYSYVHVLHDFKKDGFLDIQQITYAYGTIKIGKVLLQLETLKNYNLYNYPKSSSFQRYNWPTTGKTPQWYYLGFQNFLDNRELNGDGGDDYSFDNVAVDILDVINGGVNLIDKTYTKTIKEGNLVIDFEMVESASLFFDKDKMTLEFRGTLRSQTKQQLNIDSYTLYTHSRDFSEGGFLITEYSWSQQSSGLNIGKYGISADISISDITIQAREHEDTKKIPD